MSLPVMTRRGFSPANGSGRKPLPALKSAGALMPPVYSGIVPSLLPAFSAPTAVSVVPICLASSAETAANAAPLKIAAKLAASIVVRSMMAFPCLESRLERERDPAAIGERRVRAVGYAQHAAFGRGAGRA